MFVIASAAKTTFKAQVKLIKERMELKENEISGEWLTDERMNRSGECSKSPDCSPDICII